MSIVVRPMKWLVIYTCVAATISFKPANTMAQAPDSANESAALDIGECPSRAQFMDFMINKTYMCSCGRDIAYSEIYGTDVYSMNSDICTAAVHAGVIQKRMPGRVVFETMDSPPVFKGSTRNGIKSLPLPHPFTRTTGPGAYRVRPSQ
jgi:hypothetical protein